MPIRIDQPSDTMPPPHPVNKSVANGIAPSTLLCGAGGKELAETYK